MPSFQDLAKRAKVSVATVSRVARGRTSVDAAIAARVKIAAKELGIDLDARRHDRATVSAFILANRDVLHGFQARVLLGAENYCASQHKELLFTSFHYSPNVLAADLPLPQILNRDLVRAVILGGTNSPNMLEALRARKIPFSVLGNNVIGEWDPTEYDSVSSDDVQGAGDLAAQLIADGHRDIWFIGNTELPWYARCARGYRETMLKAGLEPRISEVHSDGRELGYLAMRSIISRGEPVSAIFAGSDPVARGVFEAARTAGLRIPEDLSVAGFNDSEASFFQPPLTSVCEFPEEIGRHLAELALRRIEEPDREPRQLTLATRVVLRESTRVVQSRK
jgi:DNA-binding LacI/PurR family transcriptional regulator